MHVLSAFTLREYFYGFSDLRNAQTKKLLRMTKVALKENLSHINLFVVALLKNCYEDARKTFIHFILTLKTI